MNRMNSNLYIIQPGDTLTKISRKTGVPIEALIQLNAIQNADKIRAGDTLNLLPEDELVYFMGELPAVEVTARMAEMPGDVFLSDGTVFNYDLLQYMIDTAENSKEKEGAIKVMKKYINKAILEHPDATIFRNILNDKQMMSYLDKDVKELLFGGLKHKLLEAIPVLAIPEYLAPIGRQGMKINYLKRYEV